MSKTVVIGNAKEPSDFIKVLGNAYKNFTEQKGGFEEGIYKLKYLKYKAKYTELKAQIGGMNRFILIIKTYFNKDHHSYYYYIVDNDKPKNITTFGSSIIFLSDPTKTYENIVAYYNDQTPLHKT